MRAVSRTSIMLRGNTLPSVNRVPGAGQIGGLQTRANARTMVLHTQKIMLRKFIARLRESFAPAPKKPAPVAAQGAAAPRRPGQPGADRARGHGQRVQGRGQAAPREARGSARAGRRGGQRASSGREA